VIAIARRTISLIEHESILISQDEMTQEEGEKLWRRYGDYVEVTFPSPVTSGNWRLSAGGGSGTFPSPRSSRWKYQSICWAARD
jgi:hypothetical protein